MDERDRMPQTLDEVLKVVPWHGTIALGLQELADCKKLIIEGKWTPPDELPTRAESGRRKHVLHTIESLLDYLGACGGENTMIFLDGDARRGYAVLDEAAGDGIEEIELRLLPHKLWLPWAEAIAVSPFSLDRFVEFIRLHRRAIHHAHWPISQPAEAQITPRELLAMLSQVRVGANVTVERGHGPDSVNGVMVETKISGRTDRDNVPLPEALRLDVPIFVGVGIQDVDVDIVVDADPDTKEVTVSMSTADVEAALDKAWEQIVAAAQASQWKVVLGHPERDRWAYVEGTKSVPY